MIPSNEQSSRVIVAGTNGSGKTALMNCLAKKEFDPLHNPTIGVEFSKILLTETEASFLKAKGPRFEEKNSDQPNEPGFELKELVSTIKQRDVDPRDQIDRGMVSVLPPKPSYLQLWELTGGEAFQQISITYYSKVMLVLVVVDLNDESAVKEAQYWIRKARINLRRSNTVDPDRAEDAEILLIGNKEDLLQGTAPEIQRQKELEELALKHEIMFLTFSAKLGHRDVLLYKILESHQKAVFKYDQRETAKQQLPKSAASSDQVDGGTDTSQESYWTKFKRGIAGLKTKLLN